MRAIGVAAVVWVLALLIGSAQSRSVFPGTLDQHPAIDYRSGALADVVTVLRRDAAAGALKLAFDGTQGYLRSMLAALDVPVESQVLLFSKTGLQHQFTSPENPRALYFNDRVVVGYIPGAPFLEMASHDPRQGIIFQTLKQDSASAEFARPDRCLGCHLSANSLEVPGILVRSLFTGPDGRALPQQGSFLIDHRSPIEQRWGGWYVTGAEASARHMGTAIDARAQVSLYPLPTSDVVALMVFDHQGRAMNLLTRLGWESRFAAAENRVDFSRGELAGLLKETVDYFTFASEPPLTGAVRDGSPFANSFAASGPRDRHGRSLRELDLRQRLFKHRVSYMIHSPAFDALPEPTRTAFYAALRGRIHDADTLAILDDTKPGWR
ncbi:MAG TPA: hypothetical protein VEA16_07420 [Vicinamibacterales bacterium]|nr:hypothetical protein [Vicinamibacterales bacterium]